MIAMQSVRATMKDYATDENANVETLSTKTLDAVEKKHRIIANYLETTKADIEVKENEIADLSAMYENAMLAQREKKGTQDSKVTTKEEQKAADASLDAANTNKQAAEVNAAAAEQAKQTASTKDDSVDADAKSAEEELKASENRLKAAENNEKAAETNASAQAQTSQGDHVQVKNESKVNEATLRNAEQKLALFQRYRNSLDEEYEMMWEPDDKDFRGGVKSSAFKDMESQADQVLDSYKKVQEAKDVYNKNKSHTTMVALYDARDRLVADIRELNAMEEVYLKNTTVAKKNVNSWMGDNVELLQTIRSTMIDETSERVDNQINKWQKVISGDITKNSAAANLAKNAAERTQAAEEHTKAAHVEDNALKLDAENLAKEKALLAQKEAIEKRLNDAKFNVDTLPAAMGDPDYKYKAKWKHTDEDFLAKLGEQSGVKFKLRELSAGALPAYENYNKALSEYNSNQNEQTFKNLENARRDALRFAREIQEIKEIWQSMAKDAPRKYKFDQKWFDEIVPTMPANMDAERRSTYEAIVKSEEEKLVSVNKELDALRGVTPQDVVGEVNKTVEQTTGKTEPVKIEAEVVTTPKEVVADVNKAVDTAEHAAKNINLQANANASTPSLNTEAIAFGDIAKAASDAAKAKDDFVRANERVKASAEASKDPLKKEKDALGGFKDGEKITVHLDIVPDPAEFVTEVQRIIDAAQNAIDPLKTRIELVTSDIGFKSSVDGVLDTARFQGANIPSIYVQIETDDHVALEHQVNQAISKVRQSELKKIVVNFNPEKFKSGSISVPIKVKDVDIAKLKQDVLDAIKDIQKHIKPLEISFNSLTKKQVTDFINAANKLSKKQQKSQQQSESAKQKQIEKQQADHDKPIYDSIVKTQKEILKLKEAQLGISKKEAKILQTTIDKLEKEVANQQDSLISDKYIGKAVQNISDSENAYLAKKAKFDAKQAESKQKQKNTVKEFKVAEIDAAKKIVQDYRDSIQNGNSLTKEQLFLLDKMEEQLVHVDEIKQKTSRKKIISKDDVDNVKSVTNEVLGNIKKIDNLLKSNAVIVESGLDHSDALKRIKEVADKEGSNFLSSKIVNGEWIRTYKDASGVIHTVTRKFDKLTQSIYDVEGSAIKSASAVEKFISSLAGKWQDVARYLLSYGSLYEVLYIFKRGFEVIREMDAAMVEVRKVSDETTATYAAFEKQMAQVAKQVATTNTELRNSAADWLRLGESIEDAATLAENAAVYVNVGDGIDIDTATSDMIIAMRAFNIEASESMKIVDAYNEVGNNFSISAGGIGEVMARSASALQVANNTFAESIALGTAMNEQLQDTEQAGSALKILSLRIRGVASEIEAMGESTDGMVTSTSKMQEKIKAYTNIDGSGGFDILDANGNFKSTAEIAKGIGQVFSQMSDIDQAGLLELIAGKNRSNAVASLLNNWERIDEVIESVNNSEGSALKENRAIVDSIDGRIKILQATAEEFWVETTSQEGIKNTITLLTKLLELLTAIVDKAGLFSTILSVGVGGITAANGIGITNVYALHGGNSMSY